MSSPLELEDAQARLLDMLVPTPSRPCPVESAAQLFLAQPVTARRTQPPTDLSAMDGYATVGDGPWELAGESRAGAPFPKAPSKGMAVRISTGAQMPFPADAVLIQENARIEDNRLVAIEPPTPRYIRRAGFDFHASDTLLEPGVRLGAAQIALARAGGLSQVVVHDRPRVAVIECGDELCADPTDCPPGLIPSTNGAMLGEMARDAGANVARYGPLPDDAEAITRTILEASGNAALVVISGGASVGPHDLVKPALEAAGFTLAGQAAAGGAARGYGGPRPAGQSGLQLRHRVPVHAPRNPEAGRCARMPAPGNRAAACRTAARRWRAPRIPACRMECRGCAGVPPAGQLGTGPTRAG